VKREIQLLKKMKHENIMRLYETFETANFVFLVMEYLGGKSLQQYLKEFPDRIIPRKQAKLIFRGIC